MQDSRQTALSLMDSLLSGGIAVGDFCSRYEQLFNFEWPDRGQDVHVEQFQKLFEAVVWYSPFPKERENLPHYKSESDIIATVKQVRSRVAA